MTKLSTRLSQLRIDNGKMKEELVVYLSITMDSYNRYERGTRQPDIDTLIKLADFYDVTLDYLLGRVESEQLYPDRGHLVTYKDLVSEGLNGKLAHGLISEIVSKQSSEERIVVAGSKIKYVTKDDLRQLLMRLMVMDLLNN